MADPTAWTMVEAGGAARRPRARAGAPLAAASFLPDLP
jgi:hypothetical protein